MGGPNELGEYRDDREKLLNATALYYVNFQKIQKRVEGGTGVFFSSSKYKTTLLEGMIFSQLFGMWKK